MPVRYPAEFRQLMRQARIAGTHRRRRRECTRRDLGAQPSDDLVKRAFDPKEPDSLVPGRDCRSAPDQWLPAYWKSSDPSVSTSREADRMTDSLS
jgi:hypothetical protein